MWADGCRVLRYCRDPHGDFAVGKSPAPKHPPPPPPAYQPLHGLTQAQLAQAMGVTPGRVSQIERGELATIDAVARYIEALGGRLDLIASFGDHTLTITTTEAA